MDSGREVGRRMASGREVGRRGAGSGTEAGRRGAGLWQGGGLGKLPVGAGPAVPPDLLAGVLAASAPQFPWTCTKAVQKTHMKREHMGNKTFTRKASFLFIKDHQMEF